MCDMCEGGLTREELAKKTMDTIIKHGHQVRFIFPTEESVADGSLTHYFWYTIGRTVKDRPELLLTGPLPGEVGMQILNSAAAADDENPLKAGQERFDILVNVPVRIVAVCDLEDAQMHGVSNAFGEDVPALQIVWPDQDGNFPGDPGFSGQDEQPVFA